MIFCRDGDDEEEEDEKGEGEQKVEKEKRRREEGGREGEMPWGHSKCLLNECKSLTMYFHLYPRSALVSS